MSPEDRRALRACGLAWVVISKLMLGVPRASLPTRLRWVDWLAARLPAPSAHTPDEAARIITAAARLVPRTRCLEWSLALRGLLAQGRTASELRIGVAAAGPSAITAHAWVEVAGHPHSWGDTEGYSVLRPPPAAS